MLIKNEFSKTFFTHRNFLLLRLFDLRVRVQHLPPHRHHLGFSFVDYAVLNVCQWHVFPQLAGSTIKIFRYLLRRFSRRSFKALDKTTFRCHFSQVFYKRSNTKGHCSQKRIHQPKHLAGYLACFCLNALIFLGGFHFPSRVKNFCGNSPPSVDHKFCDVCFSFVF